MKLTDLIKDLEIKEIKGDPSIEIAGIAYDSGKVQKDYLFVAIKGKSLDGHDFISQALENGAKVVVFEKKLPLKSYVTSILVPDSREALAKISSQFFHNPSSKLKVIGITGTNGKTTTSFLIESILKEAGYSPGVIGTINYRFSDKIYPAPITTPESLELQQLLHTMAEEGTDQVIMEVSSHALDQKRVLGISFDGAVFTNLTQDHLDYHGTMEEYFKAKTRLFLEYATNTHKKAWAAINKDDAWGERLSQKISYLCMGFGINNSVQICPERFSLVEGGIYAYFKTPLGPLPIKSSIKGLFNLYNIAAAIAVGVNLNIPIHQIKTGLETIEKIPGRLEEVKNARGIKIFIDYAHTPDALERVLMDLKNFSHGKIITVFGCGGDRDKTKRPLMGKISSHYSDFTIISSDNPRSEDPENIIEDIERGLTSFVAYYNGNSKLETRNSKLYMKIVDRREAIRFSLELAKPGDFVLIAGKGHENYQIIGSQRIPFNDRIEVEEALKKSQ